MTTQQIRATSEAERYTKALQKQKLTFQEMSRHRGIMREVYRDQLRYQRMTAQYWGTDLAGRAVTDIAIPKRVPRDLDTMRRRMGMFGNMAASAGTQVVNLGKNIQWSGRQLMVGFTYPLAMFGAAAGVMAYKVEDAFGKINKVYDVSAAALNNQALREQELSNLRIDSMKMATDVAERYGLAVEKTLEVEQQLAATGFQGEDLMKTTSEIQRVSALGDIDPAQTTDMVVALRTAFRKTIKDGDDLTETLNFLNAVSAATSLDMQDIAESTPRAASGIAALGGTAQEMGILMVAMRESGVEASQGANALKSASTRIINPVKKAIDIYDKYGISLERLSKESGGNLFAFLKLLGEEQQKIVGKSEKQTQMMRAQGIAALFGTYQYNRLNAALVNVGDAYGGVENQTSKALDMQKASREELEKIAINAEKAMMDTSAAKFRKAWESFKIQLQSVGKPFLDTATAIVKGFGWIAEAFNNMDEWKKKAAMWVAAALGLAGPVIMLSGLFFNLFGQFIKGVGSISKFIGISKLLTKEEQAATLTAQAQNEAMQRQQKSTVTLAQEVQVLTAAYQKATQAAKQFAQTQGVTMAGGNPTGFIGPLVKPIKTSAGPYQMSPQEAQYFRSISNQNAQGKFISDQNRLMLARNKMGEDYMRVNNLAARDADKTVKSLRAQNKIQGAVTQKIGAGAVGMAAMSASMAAMMMTNNEFVNSLGKWLMIGVFVVPAVVTLAKFVAQAAKSALAMAVATRATAIAANAAAAGFAGTMRATGAGVMAGIAGLMSPVGWLVAGATALGVGWYAVNRHIKGAREEQERMAAEADKMQASTLDMTQKWAAATGKAYENYKMYNQQGDIDYNRKEKSNYEDLVSRYQQPEDEGGFREQVTEFSGLGQDQQRYALLVKMSEFVRNMGMDAKEAKMNMAAFLDATGLGAIEAQTRAEELFKTFKENKDWFSMSADASNLMQAHITEPETLKTLGKQAGTFFAQGLADANVETANAELENISNTVMAGWEKSYNQVFDNLASNLALTGAYSEAEIQQMVEASIGTADDFRTKFFTLGEEEFREYYKQFAIDSRTLDQMVEYAKAAETGERAIVGTAAEFLGMNDSVDTLVDFMNEAAIAAKTMFPTEQGAQMKAWIDQISRIDRQLQGMQDQPGIADKFGLGDAVREQMDALRDQREQLITNGRIMENFGNIKWSSTHLRDYWYSLIGKEEEAEQGAKDVKKAIDDIKGKTVEIKLKQVGGIVQTAMGAVQDRMATSAMDSFNRNWDASMDSAQASWDARHDAMENRHDVAQRRMDAAQERAQEAFDRRWEARKNAIEKEYDKRIAAVEREIKAAQKADEIRQRLFEKEKARLAELAERENTNIDFNTALTEGRLDDAAKTLNNAQVSGANAQMEAEQKAAEQRTQRKIAILEKKNDRLEKQRDKELKNLEKLEDRMRKHLERVQDARRRALEKQQADEVKALEKSEESAMDSMERQRDYEEALLEERLELFKSYTARNQKDLERWMKEVGLSYDDFGEDVKAKGEKWSSYFRKELSSQIRQAGMEVANDNIWENVGKKMGEKLLRGLGFDNLAQFNRFVRTGMRGGKGKGGAGEPETRHEGGVVGSGGGSRGGIPNTYKGLHRTEKMIRAQRGEYVINKKSTERNREVLERINSGQDISRLMPKHGRGGLSETTAGGDAPYNLGYGGPGALMAGVISNMFSMGVGEAFENAYQIGARKERRRERRLARRSQFGTRNYNLGPVKPWVSEAAHYLGNKFNVGAIGGYRASATDPTGHPAGRALDIMTNSFAHGDKIMKEIIRLRGPLDAEYAIWKQRITGGGRPWGTWSRMEDRGSPTQNHMDHIHLNFNASGDTGDLPGLKGGKGVKGSGGYWKASNPGKGWNNNSHDYDNDYHDPLYAIGPGYVRSWTIGPQAGQHPNAYPRGYGSYGVVSKLNTDSGDSVLYAHLWPGSTMNGRVRGGQKIAEAASTGNSSGSHTHFEVNGSTNAKAAFERMGIPLRTGGTIRYDNTPVIAHRGETMLTAPLTKQFKENVASRGGDQYHVTLDLRGSSIKEDVDIKKAVYQAIEEKESKKGRKRVVR